MAVSVVAAIAQRNVACGSWRQPAMKSSCSFRRTASWSASVERGSLGRALGALPCRGALSPAPPGARSSMPSSTARVISSSHSRSLGSACAAGGEGSAGRAGGRAAPVDPVEHAASRTHGSHRTMHRC